MLAQIALSKLEVDDRPAHLEGVACRCHGVMARSNSIDQDLETASITLPLSGRQEAVGGAAQR